MRKMATVIAIGLSVAATAGCGWERGGARLALPETQRLERTLELPTPTPSPIPAAPAEPPIPSTLQPYISERPKPVPIPQPAQPIPPIAAAPAAPAPEAKPAESAAPQNAKPTKPKKERADKKSVPVQQHRVAQKALSLAEIRRKYPTYFKVAGSPGENKIALTFDDGPDDKFTAQVLDVLKKNNVKATFFVVGSRAKAHPDLIARMVREGHIVGNHSYNHANLPKLTAPNFEQQIESTQSVIRSLTGYEPRLLRPPYGAVNEEQVRWAVDHQFLIVNWNVDSLDWKGLSAEQVTGNILSSTKAGSIILQHCGGGDSQDLSGTVKALPIVIQKLKGQGFQFVTVPELLHVPKNK